MGKPWLPLAIIFCVASSFTLWYAMDEWERARYFPILAGLPVTVFATLGLFKRE
jgi:hypothetical protein